MSEDLGYKPAEGSTGKDGYNPGYKDGKDNYHQAPKARQDGVNQKKGGDATEALWGQEESEGKGKTK